MRILTAAAVAALLASAYLAPRHHARREPALPTDRFVSKDPLAMVRDGEADRALGVAMAGYEDRLRDHPEDLDALRGRIRTGFLIASVGVSQPQLEATVQAQIEAYLQNRSKIDPDGSFLRGVLEGWIAGRLELPSDKPAGFYAGTAAAIFTAARGDPKAVETLFDRARRGPFYTLFFPFARRDHPAWPAVEPLVVHYLEHGDLPARVEAGVTLLDYNGLFDVGGDLVDRFLPVIRSSIREMRERVRTFVDEGSSEAGRAAILGMALLANRGEADEMRRLTEAKDERELKFYAPFADTARIARLCVGLDDFASLGPLTVRFKDLDPFDQELYYVAAAHRATRLCRDGGSAPELLDLIEAAFDGNVPSARVSAIQVLLRLAPERGDALVARAIDAHAAISIHAGALADYLDDPVALFLPAMGSSMPDLAAIAAASLVDRPLPHVLQR